MRNVLEEVQMEVIKNSLHKLYLEDFYRLTQVGRSVSPSVVGRWSVLPSHVPVRLLACYHVVC